MPPKKQLDLYLEVDILTAGTTAKVVNAILESLLYQRNQIPFVYKTYRYYVNKWMEQDEKEENIDRQGSGIHSFNVQRKKQQATTTKQSISAMRETIKSIFENKRIKSLRFLFGPTTFTAKESYTIHIPTENISLNHLNDHHRIQPVKLNQTLLSFLTSEDLYTIFSNNMNPTNIYLELEILENDKSILNTTKDSMHNSQIFPKDNSSLPASCKDVHLHLHHKHSPMLDHKLLKCCKELQVFDEIINLRLECESEEQEVTDNNKIKKTVDNTIAAWWEAEIVVRGFKDQPIKGFNIWSQS